MVGYLMHLISTIRDLSYFVYLIAIYIERLTNIHLAAVRRIIRYMKGTLSLGTLYKSVVMLQERPNSSYGGDTNDQKGTLGYMFILESEIISVIQEATYYYTFHHLSRVCSNNILCMLGNLAKENSSTVEACTKELHSDTMWP